ncbi:MAG: hypothetical protein ACYSUD_22560 [Planctomycetota bacterium]
MQDHNQKQNGIAGIVGWSPVVLWLIVVSGIANHSPAMSVEMKGGHHVHTVGVQLRPR